MSITLPNWLSLGFVLLAAGCQFDPYADLFTTELPKSVNLVGRYVLTSQMVNDAGLAALNGKPCEIELRADGSFSATNVLAKGVDSPAPNFFLTLVSGTGTWEPTSVGSISDGFGPSKTLWGVGFDSSAGAFESVGLTGSGPPYGLIYTIGDPDAGDAMIFERAK